MSRSRARTVTVVEGRPVLDVRPEDEEQVVAALADLLADAMERENETPARRQPAGVNGKGDRDAQQEE